MVRNRTTRYNRAVAEAKQFLNDLNNPDIIDLKQLDWMFDAAKNPDNFVENMRSAIRNLDNNSISKVTLDKFKVANADELKNVILGNFDSIFKLK
ncbi:MAG: hypothetical protein LBV11_00990 [Bacillus cereus]|nr:hypothetical protein [Bacillus cereus]